MKLQGLCDSVTRSCSCQRRCDWGGSTCSFASSSHRLALSLGLALHPPFPATFVSISLDHTLQQQYSTPHRMRTAISRASNAASTPLRSAWLTSISALMKRCSSSEYLTKCYK
jgi:hypothetical protein